MPNSLTSAGLTTATGAELTTAQQTSFQAIYGPNISLGSDTPDGQIIGIWVQSVVDVLNLITQVYNSFSPDFAIGAVLDQRVAINGIQRQAGTFTVTPITIVTSTSVNLYGLDQTAQQVYTVSDSAGNLWELETTQLGVAAGTNVFSFQAASPGAVTTTPNTITVQVTIVLGVTSVNNPTTYTTLGENEESDAALRIRRQISVSLASQGYLQGLLAALENINGVTSAYVYENVTGSTDGNNVPGHSIWVITAGTGAPASIAQAIYTKRNAGCGMKGSQSFVITQVDGTLFTVLWDDVVTVNLFIRFTATSLNGVNPPNIQIIRAGLPTGFVPTVFEEVNINALATEVQILDPNTLVTNAGFSTGQTQILTLSGVAASGTFEINYNGNTSAAIDWNDSIGTIQTKVQAVTGLTAALVTGSIASQTLTFNLTALTNVAALIYVVSNTLMTSAPAAITFAYNQGYTNTLTPSSKQYQFVVSSPDIIILPIVILPTSATVAPLGTQQFAAYGGYGAYTWSLSINNSGGSINSSSGLYTAGSTGLVADTVQVVDAFGVATTTVVVTVT